MLTMCPCVWRHHFLLVMDVKPLPHIADIFISGALSTAEQITPMLAQPLACVLLVLVMMLLSGVGRYCLDRLMAGERHLS